MSCTRRKTRGSWSLICLVLAMFWLFRHAVRKQPLLIKKVQWSSFEKRRGDDVMSTSFWFQGVPCVACFVVCPHFVFKFGFACRVVECGCAFDCDSVCDVCLQFVFLRCHTLVVVLPSESEVVQHGCIIALRECFPCEWFVLFPTSRAVTCSRLFFLCLTVAARKRTNHFAGHSGASTVFDWES